MNSKILFDNIKIERNRRLNGLLNVDPHSEYLWNKVLKLVESNDDKTTLLKAYDFAKKIDYKHDGMSSDIYFAHPKRVASYSFLDTQRNNIDVAIIGLIHNVFELTDYSEQFIENLFGKNIKDQIINLTVDRNLQYDFEYKKSYYSRIVRGPLESRIVKIFDKVDNLFTLSLNPDDYIREKYLKEIEDYILPMAKNDLPLVHDYIISQVKFNRKIGYLTK